MTTFNLSVLCMYMPIQFALVNVTQCEFWKEMIISGRPGCRQAGCCYCNCCWANGQDCRQLLGILRDPRRLQSPRISSVKFKVQAAF